MGNNQKKKKNHYFDRVLDIFLIPGNIQKITAKFLEFFSFTISDHLQRISVVF